MFGLFMSFEYISGSLHWDNTDLSGLTEKIAQLLKEKYAYTGAYYLYNTNIFLQRATLFEQYFPEDYFFYSVKSLSNLHFLSHLSHKEQFGTDVVSSGEMVRAARAGFQGERIVFAGVGKTAAEIQLGIDMQIHSFHVESLAEIRLIGQISSESQKHARISFRINPDVHVDTHKHITTGKEENKFGLAIKEIPAALDLIKSFSHASLVGIQSHIGSQILDHQPYLNSLGKLIPIAKEIEEAGFPLEYISLGGGFGIDYKQNPYSKKVPEEFSLETLSKGLHAFRPLPWKLYFEPGRFISAPSGVLITNVTYKKEKTGFSIAITDAGMGDLMRPALYGAVHPIYPVREKHQIFKVDIAGPICESTDYFSRQTESPELSEGDRLAILHAGAYGATMGSIYNTRPLIPEIAFDSSETISVIRRPQTLEELLSLEIL